MSSIGNIVKMYREQRGLSQQELAFKIRVGTRTIEKIEEGISIPDTQTILKISTALDVPASELVVSQTGHPNKIDSNLEALIHLIGEDKVKKLLNKIKTLSDDDFERLLQLL